MTSELVTLAVCWGWFEPGGYWRPSPALALTPDEQYAQNLAAGHITPGCMRDDLRPLRDDPTR